MKLAQTRLLLTFRQWITLASTIIAFGFIVYVATQQSIRLSANDPQIQIAQDIVTAIKAGNDPRAFPITSRVDYSKSLATFVMLFDQNGKVIVSNGQLDNKMPTPPQGVFKYAQANGENRRTWEPKQGVRLATVIIYYKTKNDSGYVLVGRSLNEIEKRENTILLLVGVLTLATLLITFITTLLSLGNYLDEKFKK